MNQDGSINASESSSQNKDSQAIFLQSFDIISYGLFVAVVVREVPLLTLKILVIDVFDVPCGQNCVVGCSLASISKVQGVKTSNLVVINVDDLLLDEFKLE